MAENRWSHGDPNDPLSWHLDELRYEAQCRDPLAPEWFDGLVLVSRKYVKDLVGRAIASNNQAIWDSINNLEAHVSAVDDALAEVDQATNDIAAELEDLASQLKGKDQAVAEQIKARAARLRQVGADANNPGGGDPVTEEPVEDGEPIPASDPQTVPVEGGDPLPVSNFPAEDVNDDGQAETSSDVPAPSGADSGVDSESK